MAHYQATRPLQLWPLDEDADFSSPCADTDDSSQPWATGEGTFKETISDLTVTLTRMDTFSFPLQATVARDGRRRPTALHLPLAATARPRR